MSATGGPGQGTTLGLSVDTTLSRLRSIQLPEHSTEGVDFTGLDQQEWFQYIAATLKDGGVFVAEMYFNSEISLPTLRTVQTATITLPKQTPASVAGATLVGSGFVVNLGLPNAVIGEPLIQTVTFRFDGIGTVPTWTPEA